MARERNPGAASAAAHHRPGVARRIIHLIYRESWRRPGVRRILDLIPTAALTGVAEVSLWGGGRLLFPLQAAGVAASLWKVGAHEALETALVSRLAPGRVFYDVGANVGYYTVIAASAGARRTVAVEPFPATLAFLHQNVARNNLPGVTVLEIAAGSTETSAPLHDGLGFGTSSMSLTTAVSAHAVATVRVGSLDTALEKQGLPEPDLLKIDAEGSEAAVIAGFRATIRRSRPTILIELNERLLNAAGTSRRQVLNQLHTLGYDRLVDVGGRRPRPFDSARTMEALAYAHEAAARVESALTQ